MDERNGNKAVQKKYGFWNFIDGIAGDKVIWMVVLFLMMVSILAIYSSSIKLAKGSITRPEIFRSQIIMTFVGLGLIFGIYKIRSVRLFMMLSQLGFFLSAFLLIVLASRKSFLFFVPEAINGVWRVIKIGSFQLHVYEVVKVAMVMYMAWAIHMCHKDEDMIKRGEKSTVLWLANLLSNVKHLEWMSKTWVKHTLYIYVPVIIVVAIELMGGGSSAIFLAGVMVVMMILGKMPFKEMLLAGISVLMFTLFCVQLDKWTDHKIPLLNKFQRFETMKNRVGAEYDPTVALKDLTPGTKAFRDALDGIEQPNGAKIAIHEGGIFGKGCGNSTQKFKVSNIYDDFMFSFIIEEYGVIGALLLLSLYVSLFARGAQISSKCTKDFTKLTVGGLTLLISGQAFMHMIVNLDVGVMTGQTLPLVSNGKSSFICFCIAFGVLLSISRITKLQELQAGAEQQAEQHAEQQIEQQSLTEQQ